MATGKQKGSNNDDEIYDSDFTCFTHRYTTESNSDDENNASDKYVPPKNTTERSTAYEQRFYDLTTKEVRLVLVGRTGSGKSSTCNSILGYNCFETSLFMKSATTHTQHGKRDWGIGELIVVDTPGFFDTEQSDDQIESEVVKCVGMLYPGPHAFLYTIKIGCRHTKEEVASLQKLIKIFGNNISKFLIIIFTGKDMLGDMKLDKYLENTTQAFNTILEKVGKDKCFAISNNLPNESSEDTLMRTDNVETVNAIISKIYEMIHISPPKESYYSNEMLRSSQSSIMRRANELEHNVSPALIRDEIADEGVVYNYLMLSNLRTMVAKLYAGIQSLCTIM